MCAQATTGDSKNFQVLGEDMKIFTAIQSAVRLPSAKVLTIGQQLKPFFQVVHKAKCNEQTQAIAKGGGGVR